MPHHELVIFSSIADVQTQALAHAGKFSNIVKTI